MIKMIKVNEGLRPRCHSDNTDLTLMFQRLPAELFLEQYLYTCEILHKVMTRYDAEKHMLMLKGNQSNVLGYKTDLLTIHIKKKEG